MKNIYLDNAATTPVDIDCYNQASKIAVEQFYNPSSLYRNGRAVSDIIKQSRSDICQFFPHHKLVFTSCGTEADNTAVFGYFRRGNAVTSLGEHSAVFQCFENLRAKGLEVRNAKLNIDGSVNVEHLLSLVDKNTTFISVVHVNNETGAINDINDIARRAKEIAPRLIFHSDGVQAFGKIEQKPDEFVDLYSVSAHKIGGLKGIGCLFYKSQLHFNPYIFGGGQEFGFRSGTENVLGVVDFSLCARKVLSNVNERYNYVKMLKDTFLQKIDKNLFTIISSNQASPYVISISAKGLRGEVIQHMLDDCGILVGTGSACSSKHPHSRVLKACGYLPSILDGVIRVSFSFDTKLEDVLFAVEQLNSVANKLSKVINK